MMSEESAVTPGPAASSLLPDRNFPPDKPPATPPPPLVLPFSPCQDDSTSMQATTRVAPASTLPFRRMVFLWLCGVSFLGGVALFLAERGHMNISFIDAVFLGANAATASGLSPVDVAQLCALSKTVLILAVQLGSSTMISLVPVYIRMQSLRPLLPLEGAAFDLQRYRRVPQWLVEYKALVILLRIMLAYQAILYLTFFLAIYAYVASSPHLAEIVRDEAGTGPAAFSAFHVLSAYNNAGFSLQSTSFSAFDGQPGLLSIISLLCLLGNVLLPIVLRWILVVLSFLSSRKSSRKVYFRYLLLNGRDVYSNIFVSQQTWVLFITQLILICTQVSIIWVSSADSEVYEEHGSRTRFALSFFQAVNTRHAGLKVLEIAKEDPSVLVVYILMMFLAPVPFMLVLRSSTNVASGKTREMLSMEESPGGALVFDGQTLEPGMSSVMTDEERQQSLGMAGHSLQRSVASVERMLFGDEVHSTRAEGYYRLPEAGEDQKDGASLLHDANTSDLSWHDGHLLSSRSMADLEATHLPRERPASYYGGSTRMVNVRMLMRQKQIQETQNQLRQRIKAGRWREEDYLVDTRVLLMVAYPNERVPYATRLTARARAVMYHLFRIAVGFANSIAARDLVLLWFAWYLICASGGRGNVASRLESQFAVFFEIVSAYGNVGLSLGSDDPDNPYASFSAGFSTFGKIVIIAISILGALRGLPLHVDSVLTIMHPPPLSELLRDPETDSRSSRSSVEFTARDRGSPARSWSLMPFSFSASWPQRWASTACSALGFDRPGPGRASEGRAGKLGASPQPLLEGEEAQGERGSERED